MNTYRCRGCGAVGTSTDDRAPTHGLRLNIVGGHRDDLPCPGLYCSLACLTVEVLRCHSLTLHEAREWIASTRDDEPAPDFVARPASSFEREPLPSFGRRPSSFGHDNRG